MNLIPTEIKSEVLQYVPYRYVYLISSEFLQLAVEILTKQISTADPACPIKIIKDPYRKTALIPEYVFTIIGPHWLFICHSACRVLMGFNYQSNDTACTWLTKAKIWSDVMINRYGIPMPELYPERHCRCEKCVTKGSSALLTPQILSLEFDVDAKWVLPTYKIRFKDRLGKERSGIVNRNDERPDYPWSYIYNIGGQFKVHPGKVIRPWVFNGNYQWLLDQMMIENTHVNC